MEIAVSRVTRTARRGRAAPAMGSLGGTRSRVVRRGLFAGALLALLAGGQVRAEYVSANTLNCRASPDTSAPIVAKLDRGREVSVEKTSHKWSRLKSPDCWVLSRYLANYRPATLYTPSRSSTKKGSSSRTSRPTYNRSNASGCPCSGNRVCIGPRGGRYCITSGGNKRYGV